MEMFALKSHWWGKSLSLVPLNTCQVFGMWWQYHMEFKVMPEKSEKSLPSLQEIADRTRAPQGFCWKYVSGQNHRAGTSIDNLAWKLNEAHIFLDVQKKMLKS